MFEHIEFLTYEVPHPVTPSAMDCVMADTLNPDFFDISALKHHELPDNMKHADFFITGKLEAFSKPPIPDSTKNLLYHMENFSIFHCDEHFFTKRKDFHSYLILYTYEGQGLLEYEGKTYCLHPGDGFLIDCKKPHVYRSHGQFFKHSVLHLGGPLLDAFFEQYIADGSVIFSQPVNGTYQHELERLLHIYSNASLCRDWQASDCISSILTDLLLTASQNHQKNSALAENLQYLCYYMEQNFTSLLTLDYLSKFSGISKYYLTREFKKYTGFTPNDYLILLRMERAKTLLQSTTLPANKIAHMVGIHDLNNFTNLFKKKTGTTPGQYRKNLYCC